MSLNNNINNSEFISSLERKGVIDQTKNFIRNTLYEKLKNNNIPEETKYKLYPSNFNIDDQNLYTMFKLEYTLIDDFLIRTKLNYTHSIFNNEIKSLIKPLIPLDDIELMNLLGINMKELNELRYKWNNSNDSSDQIKSTYLYQILNSHTKIMKIDEVIQTNDLPIFDNALYSPDVRVGVTQPIDIELRLKNIEEKYNKKIKEENNINLIENRLKEYKDDLDKRYEKDLKNEIDRFKNYELSKVRIDEKKKYSIELEKVRDNYQEEYNKKYEELKRLQKELEDRESKLQNEYEERYKQLKKRYEEKEKALDAKENYLEKKYKNDMDISAQKIKFKEELVNSLMKESLFNDKENNNKGLNKHNNKEINNEIDFLKKEIEQLKDLMIKQPLKNNYVKKEEDKKNYYYISNNVKPSKESVLNSLNLLAKTNNSNNLNKSKSSNSPSGSGIINNNNKIQYKNDRRKILEELEEEQYKLNNQMREDFQKILHGDGPIMIMDKDDLNNINLNNNYNIDTNKYKPKEIYDFKNYKIEEIKNNNYVKDNNIYVKDNDNDFNRNLDNNIVNNKNEYNNNYNNLNYENNNYFNDFSNKQNIEIKKDLNENNINNNININDNKNFKNNNINDDNIDISKKRENNSINNNINKIKKDTTPQNNIGGYSNIGGYNLAGYNFSSNNNNLYNYPIKSNTSNSIIEENIEAEGFKKENSIKKNNILSSNKYQNDKNAIKEENEEQSAGSINNSKEMNNKQNINNNINIKESKFNNYDYNEDINDVKNYDEIEENINYEMSANKDDLSDKKKMEMASISGIPKKAEVSESAAFFGGIIQMQSHAGGLGNNEKESFPDFELSKGKNNSKNKKGNEKQNKFNQQNPYSEDIQEEINSSGSHF